eukprot:3796182-Prymnesium_polylepis.1
MYGIAYDGSIAPRKRKSIEPVNQPCSFQTVESVQSTQASARAKVCQVLSTIKRDAQPHNAMPTRDQHAVHNAAARCCAMPSRHDHTKGLFDHTMRPITQRA